MKFRNVDGELQLVEENKDQVETAVFVGENGKAYIVDVNDLKNTWKFIKNDWFGGKSSTREVGTTVFWSLFIAHIFPIMLDIAKVYCAIMIAKTFYQEHRGGRQNGSGFEGVVQYGKWLIMFTLLPWAVEFIGEIGEYMYNDLTKK